MKSAIHKISGFILWLLYSNILIYSSFYFNWRRHLDEYGHIIAAFIIIITAITVIWLYETKKNKDTNISVLGLIKLRPGFSILSVICGLAVNSFYFGKAFLYEETGYRLSSEGLYYFMPLFLSVYVYILLSVCILNIFKDIIRIKAGNKTGPISKLSLKSHFFILFTIQVLTLGIYFYALNPGNMSYDTYNQISQLKGIIPFNTWHPIGHTLFIGLLLEIWDNYAVITVFQILFFSAVTSAFCTVLIKNNVKWQIVYITAAVMSSIPSTGINAVTQWKDIPFTVGLLWSTLMIFKMKTDKEYFGRGIHIFEFIFCLLSIALFRFNGIPAFVLILIWAFVYAVKTHSAVQKRNFYISAVIILSVFILINKVIPDKLDAIPNPPGMKLRPVYQGLAAVYAHGAEDDLTGESRKLAESVCTPRQMRDFYNPYFADSISSNTPEFLNKLSKIKTGDALKMYVEAFIAQPAVILGDKLNLSVTMWSVTNDPFSYNNAYTTAIQREMTEKYGVHRSVNIMTDTIEKLAKNTFYENYLSNTLIWRPGFFLSLELILLLYLIILRDKRAGLFIPLICNGAVVFLTMPAQDFRYLWFIQLMFPFLVLACLVKLPEE